MSELKARLDLSDDTPEVKSEEGIPPYKLSAQLIHAGARLKLELGNLYIRVQGPKWSKWALNLLGKALDFMAVTTNDSEPLPFDMLMERLKARFGRHDVPATALSAGDTVERGIS